MSLGFEQAGFDVVAAVEIDPIHAAIHRYNFPECAVIPQPVQNISGDRIREISGIGDRPIDTVFGGAPCQGFSLIGQRVLDDPRNALVKDFVRIVRELDASYFVFENVKGLTIGRHKKFLEELIEAFEASNYEVQRKWRVLNAANYGVPQDRQRLFLIGAKRGFRIPVYPEPLTVRPDRHSDLLTPKGPTCFEALDDLPDAESFADLLQSDETVVNPWQAHSDYAREMRCESPSSWHYGYKRRWNADRLTASYRTEHSTISRTRFTETKPGLIEPISRFFKLSPDGICNTLRAGTDGARGAFTSPRPIHYRYSRCITVREMARLHGFPDWFRFHQTKWHGARQIGNSVPPPLARAVAFAIIDAMGIQVQKPRRSLDLGDDSLLRMDLTQAAKYWGVPSPLSKRTRKSGATKRTQAQTETERLGLLAS